MRSNAGSDFAFVCTWITAFGSWVFAFFAVANGDNLIAGAIAMLAAAVAFGSIVRALAKLRAP